MKMIAWLQNRVLFALLVGCFLVQGALVSCAGPSTDDEEPLSGHISIEHLKTLANGSSTVIVNDIFIEGYVVANDLYGEYYKSIVVCDNSGGIEIGIDCDNLATRFPLAAHVVVYCSSLALGNYGGTLTLGAKPTSGYSVDRIAELDIDRFFRIDASHALSLTPRTVSISELAPYLIGDYLLLNDVTFGDQAGMTWCDTDPESGDFVVTERMLYDRQGATVKVRIHPRCVYAAEQIPAGYGKLCAVVEYFNGEYLLRVVNRMITF